ncbi:MAG TPA: hypothetical protein VH593_05780, partial [Ktedonobacteraceae bacterium]
KVLSYLATTAFTGLPEFLLPLATYTVYSHFKTWRYTKDKASMAWFFLFLVPGGFFLIVTLITLSFSMGNTQFTLPMWLIIPRGVAAFFYGFFSLIYPKIGKPQETERLHQRDEKIKALEEEMQARVAEMTAHTQGIVQQWQDETHAMRQEITALYQQIDGLNSEKSALYTSLNASDETALQAWGENVIPWLDSLDKTVHKDDIARETGMPMRSINKAIEGKELQSRGTNKALIWVPSLRAYLVKYAPKRARYAPKIERNTDGIPALHAVI